MVSTSKKYHNDTTARKLAKRLPQTGRLLAFFVRTFHFLFSSHRNSITPFINTTGRYINGKIVMVKSIKRKSKVTLKTETNISSNIVPYLEIGGFKNGIFLLFLRVQKRLRNLILQLLISVFTFSQTIVNLNDKSVRSLNNYFYFSKSKIRKNNAGKKLQSSNFNLPVSLQNFFKHFLNKIKKANEYLNKPLFRSFPGKRNQIQNVLFEKKSFIPSLGVIRYYFLRINLKTAPHSWYFKQQLHFLKPKLLLYLLGGMFIGMGTLAFAFWAIILADLPSPSKLTTRSDYEVSTKIYDRNGILLYKIFKNKNRTPVALADIPTNVRLATLAIEDAEFYSHPGFSVRGIVRSLIKNVREGELAGGSTITQQLVKNVFFTSEKTIIRKLKEVSLAVIVERQFTKDQILEMYLNEVSYGGTAYGIQEASRMYFNKDVGDLSLAEAALLAGLPKSPTQFSPFGTNPEMAIVRQRQTLRLMKINGYITEEQQYFAENAEVTFSLNTTDIKAPHFVMYVRQILENTYGKEVVEKGGLEVTTTLDYSIQQMAEQIVKDEVEKLAKLNVRNGAAIVLKPGTGEILAMVGSKDYFDTKNDGNVNIATTLQSPGSSIKVVNYAYALSHNYTPATIIDDSIVTYHIAGQPPYTPKNYDGKYRGKLTLRSSLAESRNIPAVRVLQSYGVNNMIELGRAMGITTWEDSRLYGPSLTLGGGDVKLIDLAEVYATLANYGKHLETVPLLKIVNYKGQVFEEFACNTIVNSPLMASSNTIATDVSATNSAFTLQKETEKVCEGEQVLDPRVAFIMTDILKDNTARSPAFGSNSQLVIPNHKEVAVKTGTSNDLRDNLTIGYNQYYLVAVWVGNNDNSPMSRIASGITGAAPIFNKIMTGLIARDSNHDWEIPLGLVKLPICTLTGTLTCSGCPTREEWFLEENQPRQACSEEWLRELNEQKNKKNNEENRNETPGINDKKRKSRFPLPDIF